MKNKRIATKIERRTWFTIVLLSLAGHIAWNVENSWFNTFVFDTITPDPVPVAWMVAVSAITATVTTFVMGTFSDWLGKRRPFLIYGYILWGLAIAAFPTVSFVQFIGLAIVLVVILDVVMTFFGSTANDAVYYAWLTDITDDTNRAKVLGVIAVIPLLVMALTAMVGGLVIDNYGYLVFFYGLGGFVLLVGLVTAPLIQESPDLQPTRGGKPYWRQFAGIFSWQTVQQNRSLYLLFTNIMILSIAEQISLPYLFIYLENYIAISKTVIGLVMLVVTSFAGVVTVVVGQYMDRWDRRDTAIVMGILAPFGVLVFSFLRSVPAFLALGVFYLAPRLLTVIVTGAWAMDLYPEQSRGQFQGIRMVFQVMIPMIIGPTVGSVIITRFGIPTTLNGEAGFVPTPHTWWASAFTGLLALIPLSLIRREDILSKETFL